MASLRNLPSAVTAWPAPPTSPPPAGTPAATPSEPPTCSYKQQINYAEALGPDTVLIVDGTLVPTHTAACPQRRKTTDTR
jgi:hypothetical protein